MTVTPSNLDPAAVEQEMLQAHASGGIQAAADNIEISLTNSGGYVALNWRADNIGNYDYVALYNRPPSNDPRGYLTNQWQWTVNRNSPHVTGTWASGSFWIAYCSSNSNGYFVLREAGPYIF
ncbi:hypothetical protein H6G33_19115 [Calothrix sp. FACHB-1219]|uniref:hypothetical protein n=1 Tax=unclassified Calothrix TaxID=2619626 RepID=UPI001685FA8C|nr:MULTISPECIES: hypothetical protein [unclassified Calothrix]MBD2206239.1 hypothetical protein [Calothrix sp. FACHB-168]MBD2219135.1 hypothetical protein [Calothrix sp. FACHB-1219]